MIVLKAFCNIFASLGRSALVENSFLFLYIGGNIKLHRGPFGGTGLKLP
jgi:hypothetical protein